MIGIKSVSSYVPEKFIDNLGQAERFGESPDFIKNKIGALKLPRMDSDQDASDLAVSAIRALINNNEELVIDQVDALIVVTQNGDGEGLPHTSAIVQDKIGLPKSIAAFDVSLGCSGYVYGLYILQGFMKASGLKNGLLVTADPYSKILNPDDRVTSLLFGDAATATWLGENPVLELEHVTYGTDGGGASNLEVVDGIFKMNGRQVFNFAATTVVASIKDFLKKNRLAPEEIDLYCLHQGSAAVVDAISRNFRGVQDRFVKNLSSTGNTVSSSIPLLLEPVLVNPVIPNRILVSGFGVGLSWAIATLRRADG